MKEYLRKLKIFLALEKEKQTAKEALFLYKQMQYYHPSIRRFKKWQAKLWEARISKNLYVNKFMIIRALNPIPAKIERYMRLNPDKEPIHTKFLKTATAKTPKKEESTLVSAPSQQIKTENKPTESNKELAYNFRHKKKNLRHIGDLLPEGIVDMTALEIDQQFNDKSKSRHKKIKEYVQKALEHSKNIDTIIKSKK